MSKNVRILIAGIASIAVLSGGIVALKLTEPKTDDTESVSDSSQEENLILYESESGTVKSISVKNSHGSYEIERIKDAEAEYEIPQLKGVPLNKSTVNSLPVNISTLTADKLIEKNSQELDKYGLENPDTSVKISFDNGNQKIISVGNNTPSGNSIYICFEGENDVYTVSADMFSVFRYESDYYISLVCLEAPETNDDYPIVNYLEIKRKDLEYPIKFEYDSKSANSDYSGGTSSTHIMTSPVFAYIDIGQGSTTVTHGLFGLTADSIASVNPDASELEFAGLDEPFCTVTMDTDDGYNRVLKIGNTIESNGTEYYMGYFDDTDIIYCFSKESLPWIDMQPLDIASSLIFGTYFYDIGELTVEAKGYDTLTFETEGTEKDNFKVKLDGEEYDTERFQNFYKYLINAQAEEIFMEDPSEDSLICRISIKRNDDFDDESVEFYRGNDKTVIIKHNGITSFINKVNYDYVNVLLENISRIKTNKPFSETWK